MSVKNLLETGININLLITILSYVLLVIVLAIGALKGMKRGLVRSSIRLGSLLVFIVVAALIATPISKALLTIDGTFLNVEYNGEICKTIGEAIKGLILSQEEIANMAENSPSIMAIIEGLPVALANIVVFFVLCWIMRLFSFIAYVIVDRTAIRSSKLERQQKKQRKLQKKMEKKGKIAATQSQVVIEKVNKRKGWGALVGTLQALVLVFIFMLPFNSLIGVVGDIKASAEQEQQQTEQGVYADSTYTLTVENENNENLNESVYDILVNLAGEDIMSYFDSYNSSIATKVANLGGLNNVVFDEITKVQTPAGTIKFRAEALTFVNAYDEVMRILNFSSEEMDWKNIDYDALKNVAEKVLDSNLIGSIIPEVVPYAVDNYFYESDSFKELSFSEELKTELNSLLAEYKENGFMLSFKNDIFAIYDLFVSATETDLIDKIIDGATETEIVFEFTKDNNKLFNDVFETLYSCKLLKVGTTVGLNYVSEILEEQLELETTLQKFSSTTLFAESEKQSVKDVFVAILENVNTALTFENFESIDDLTDDQIRNMAKILTALQNNAFKNYSAGVLVARENVEVNKDNLTVTNGGVFSNLYVTFVNYVLGDYLTNINYKNADWENVLISVKNLITSESGETSVSDIMAVLSLDEELGEAAKNIYEAFEQINSNEEITNEEVAELLTTISENIDNLSEETVNKIIDKVAENLEIPQIKDDISYEIIMSEKDVVIELANLYESNAEEISVDSLEKIAASELVLQEIAKYDVQIETQDANIASKIDGLSVSDDVKANLKAIFGIGE